MEEAGRLRNRIEDETLSIYLSKPKCRTAEEVQSLMRVHIGTLGVNECPGTGKATPWSANAVMECRGGKSEWSRHSGAWQVWSKVLVDVGA